MRANFLLGQISISYAASKLLGRRPLDLLARHALNDHGHITDEERASNEQSMRLRGVIVSRYQLNPTDPNTRFVLIETNVNWTKTLVSIE